MEGNGRRSPAPADPDLQDVPTLYAGLAVAAMAAVKKKLLESNKIESNEETKAEMEMGK